MVFISPCDPQFTGTEHTIQRTCRILKKNTRTQLCWSARTICRSYHKKVKIVMVLLHANRQGICSTSESTFFPRKEVLWRNLKFTRPKRRCSAIPSCSIKARWSIDIKYGVKLDAVALLQEWVMQIGSQAGLDLARTQILSGAIGIPESRLVVSTWSAKPNSRT